MKVLFIGGTGVISTACSRRAIDVGIDLYVLNRGNNNNKLPKEVKLLKGDYFNDQEVNELLKDHYFDAVVQWIAFTKEHVERDYRILKGKTSQYIFISSASAYVKPLPFLPITEEMPLGNKYWEYSDNKRICEEYLNKLNDDTFNITNVRPSHTYDDTKIVLQMKSWVAPYTMLDRMLKGKKIILPDGGSSKWTLTHNSDFAMSFVDILGNKQAYGESYHITSDKVYTWKEITESIYKALDITPNTISIPTEFILKMRPYLTGEFLGDKSNDLVFDNSKIKALSPNYSSKVDYDNIVKKAVAYNLDNKHVQNIDNEYNKQYDEIILAYKRDY
ncbi:NAD-dependent epimerase/dehydratase family protein [Candidatus Izimaplasma bacterium]|nr:NAD-dependent epimerase/dehydratase family protein [Candidatus Izimaplasma bacterium]